MKWKILTFILSIALMIMTVLLVVGCESEANESVTDTHSSFNMEYQTIDFALGVDDFYLYRDVPTGVEYIVVTTKNGVSITPRYDEYGNLVIKKD